MARGFVVGSQRGDAANHRAEESRLGIFREESVRAELGGAVDVARLVGAAQHEDFRFSKRVSATQPFQDFESVDTWHLHVEENNDGFPAFGTSTRRTACAQQIDCFLPARGSQDRIANAGLYQRAARENESVWIVIDNDDRLQR